MSFTGDLRRFKKKTKKAGTMIFRGTALDLFGKIIKRTPVGNPSEWASPAPKGYTGGSARANWQASLNSAKTDEVDATDKSGGPTIENAGAIVATAKIGDSIYLVNNLPYINRLENGWSGQAASGMVNVTVAEFKAIVRKNTK